MSQNYLWAPWRNPYISSVHKKSVGCVFCRMFKAQQDKKYYIFRRLKHCFAVLNIYPYNNGHALIVPNRHVNSLEKMRIEEKQELFFLLEEVKGILDDVLKPSGYNVGLNLGRVAGAGFPGHLHVHLVPRWQGDVNFMPISANTKVISQSLAVLYKQLIYANKTRNRKY
jgi:ATP adenylyltransferase